MSKVISFKDVHGGLYSCRTEDLIQVSATKNSENNNYRLSLTSACGCRPFAVEPDVAERVQKEFNEFWETENKPQLSSDIEDYALLTGVGNKFSEEVYKMIAKGYVPCGGIAIAQHPNTFRITYSQAMIKYKEVNNE